MLRSIEFNFAPLMKKSAIRFLVGASLTAFALFASLKPAPAASDITDACVIFHERADWRKAANKVSEKWQISVPVLLAIIHRESRFKATAAAKTSTAFGFAQAVDGTWKRYKKEMKVPTADRSSFADSADFIGWYMSITNNRLDIPLYDVKEHYLAYHEGHAGFKSKRWLQKPKLLKISTQVRELTAQYAKQLRDCEMWHSQTIPVELLNTTDPVQKPFALENIPAVLPRPKPVSRQIAGFDPTSTFGRKKFRR